VRPDPRIKLWEGTDLDLLDGEVHVVAAGGHFDGSCILIWKRGRSSPKFTLSRRPLLTLLLDRFPPIAFTADTIMVVMDRNFVSFMRSYPNMIPLKPASLIELWNRVKPHQFDELWGGFPNANLREGAKAKVFKSARRYLEQEDHALLAQQLQE
jgi:glyoxylase-like metal-dependent hydrolase (beta-lactamase superfamily II)